MHGPGEGGGGGHGGARRGEVTEERHKARQAWGGAGGAGRGAGRGPSIGHGGLRVLGQGLAAPRTPAAARRVTAPRRPPPPPPITAPLAAGGPVAARDTNVSWWKEVNEQATMRLCPAARRPCVPRRKGDGASPPPGPGSPVPPLPERVAPFGQRGARTATAAKEERTRPNGITFTPGSPAPQAFPPSLPTATHLNLCASPALPAPPPPSPPRSGHRRHAPARKFQVITASLRRKGVRWRRGRGGGGGGGNSGPNTPGGHLVSPSVGQPCSHAPLMPRLCSAAARSTPGLAGHGLSPRHRSRLYGPGAGRRRGGRGCCAAPLTSTF